MEPLKTNPVGSSINQTDYTIPALELRQEYETQEQLFRSQTAMVQRFLEAQARQIATSLIDRHTQLRYTLPDKIKIIDPKSSEFVEFSVPEELREQVVGGIIDRIARGDIRANFRHHLVELEQTPDVTISTSSSLIRHITSIQMVHNILPAGRTVNYTASEGEEIPSIPVYDQFEPESAITAATDAIVTEETIEGERRGELIVPFVPFARHFYLPQWIAFDENDELLVSTINEAQARIVSMQRFLDVLHTSIAIAPYIVADNEYQQKRYGMLGQLVNQGRALTRVLTQEIIQTIKRRAAAQDLNRGLNLSLPYFDDRELIIRTLDFDVIPAGRVMFVPAFIVRASRLEQAKIAQDTRLSFSTRKHLLAELKTIEQAFS